MRSVWMAAFLAAMSACGQTEVDYDFRLASGDSLRTTPLAEGGSFDIDVFESDGERAWLTNVVSSDPAGLSIDAFSEHGMSITARQPGSTMLTAVSGLEQSSFAPDVRAIDGHRLLPICSAPSAVYLAPGRALFQQTLFSQTTPLVAGGVTPIRADDRSAVLRVNEEGRVLVRLGIQTPATLFTSLTSTLPLGDPTLAILTRATIDAIDGSTEPALGAEGVVVGETTMAWIRPMMGTATVCDAGPDLGFQVESLTPAICGVRVSPPPDRSGEAATVAHWFGVSGVSAGDCELRIEWTGAGSSTHVLPVNAAL